MTLEELERSRVLLWQGHCSVHQRFTVAADRGGARRSSPDVHVVVHPECRYEVVQAADSNGSTEFIAKTIAKGAPGSTFAVGTEINLVSRLAHENPDKTVFCLDPVVCPCSTMYRIHPAYLAWTVEELAAGRVVNQVHGRRRDGALREGRARPHAAGRLESQCLVPAFALTWLSRVVRPISRD